MATNYQKLEDNQLTTRVIDENAEYKAALNDLAPELVNELIKAATKKPEDGHDLS